MYRINRKSKRSRMKTKEIYQAMVKEDSVWTSFPLPYGTNTKCKILKVGNHRSLLKAASGVEFETSNGNIKSEEVVRYVARDTHPARRIGTRAR